MSKNKGVDLSGLDDFSVSSLISGKLENTKEDGLLSYAPIDKFIEDENNTRKKYDTKALEELVNSIKVISNKTGEMTGVKQPLSVRKHPEKEGLFIINGGSRRYRAGKIAGLKELPYFISDNDGFDNVVDNLIRDGLKTEEVALFISKRLKAGDKQVKIAKRLGKSKSYVSDYATFYDLPDSIRELFNHGFCDSMRGLSLLNRNYKEHADEIDIFCSVADSPVSIKTITDYIELLKSGDNSHSILSKNKNEVKPDENNALVDKVIENKNPAKDSNKKDVKKSSHQIENRELVLLIEFEKELGNLVFESTLEYGRVIIKMENGEKKEVDANQIKVLNIE